jgi:hypothetical protein
MKTDAPSSNALPSNHQAKVSEKMYLKDSSMVRAEKRN